MSLRCHYNAAGAAGDCRAVAEHKRVGAFSSLNGEAYRLPEGFRMIPGLEGKAQKKTRSGRQRQVNSFLSPPKLRLVFRRVYGLGFRVQQGLGPCRSIWLPCGRLSKTKRSLRHSHTKDPAEARDAARAVLMLEAAFRHACRTPNRALRPATLPPNFFPN